MENLIAGCVPAQLGMGRGFGILLWLAALTLAGGCATKPPPSIPLDRQYQLPQRDDAVATLTGTQKKSTLFDDYTAFASSIDGKCVMSGRAGWKDPLALSGGSHKIMVKFNQGLSEAHVKLTLQVESGHAYRIAYLDGGGAILGPGSYLDFWIEDLKTGAHVTPAIRGGVFENREGLRLCSELFRVIE